MVRRTHRYRKNQWLNEFDDIVRGVSGGFLFGIPLLYTMEVWWIGSYSEPPRLTVALVGTFVIVFLLNRTAGFRKTEDIHPIDAAIDSVEAIAIGLFCSTSVLVLLQEITSDTPLGEALGKLIFESVPFTIGVAVASQFLSGTPGESQIQRPNDGYPGKGKHHRKDGLNATLADIGATLIGAVFIAFNIAPTDEVAMLSAAISPPWLIAIIVASLLISYAIVFEAGFANEEKRQQQRGIFQRPLSETVASYLVSLVAAWFMLWFFQQLSFEDPWSLWLSYTLILGLPAAIGGAAGRLAVAL